MKVILCLLAFLSAAVAQLSFPQQYEADVVIMLPYANIEEPVRVWYDGMNNMSKFSYYGGVDVYLLRGDLSNSFEIVPTTVNGSVPYTTCFVSSGAVTAQSIFPNPTGFVLQNGTQSLDGVECNVWTLVQTFFNRSSTYTVFTRASDNIPVQYRMLGYDSLLGSHYDEYVVFYKSVVPSLSDPSVFNKPSIPCVNEFGSSQFQLDAGAMFPENAASIDSYVNGEFEAFKSKHGRSYADEFEHTQRRHNFFNNMRYVNSMNRKRLSYTLKLNHLSDLSRKERLARLNKMPKAANNGASAVHEITTKPEDLPQELDWWKLGAVTPVMDQGICGSCWAHGAIETIEGSVFLATGNLTRLSPQALMDCSWSFGNTACDGGQDYLGYQWILTAGGVPTAASYPYLMADGYCHYPENGMVTGARISGYVNVTSGSEEALLDACFTRGPISISIDASQDSFSFYSSGVYYEPACKNGVNDLDHNVLLTGFGVENGQPYWLVKNSWSTHWGDNGYVKMSRLNNNCGVETGPTYVNILL